jgi:acyl carrier protein
MEREQILNIVTKHIKLNVGGLEDTVIDPSRSMVDFGASSLDIVEIVGMILRELEVRIPRTEFADLKNINEFVDVLHKYKNNGQKS